MSAAGSSDGRASLGRRGALGLVAVLLVALGVVILVLGVHTTPTGYHQHSGGRVHINPVVRGAGPATQHASSQATSRSDKPLTFPGWLKGLALAAVFGLVALLAYAVIREVWPNLRWRLRRYGRGRSRHLGEAVPDLQRRLAEVIDAGMDELLSGPVADAIIACWLRVQEVAQDSGVEPVRSDTAEQFVGRVLAVAAVRPDPLQRLAELYREARFSDHPMSEADRVAARAALGEIRADLAVTADA
jgi:hypothetical protein